MRYTKILALLTVAAAALMAFAGSAFAGTITYNSGGAQIIMDEGSSFHVKLLASSTLDGTINISCANGTGIADVTDEGGSILGWTFTPDVELTNVTNSECGNHTVSVLDGGSWSFESLGGNQATVRSSGTELTVLTHSIFLGTRHCIYVTNNTHIGTVSGTPAKLTIDSAPIPQAATDSLCGNDAEWTATYEFSSPAGITID